MAAIAVPSDRSDTGLASPEGLLGRGCCVAAKGVHAARCRRLDAHLSLDPDHRCRARAVQCGCSSSIDVEVRRTMLLASTGSCPTARAAMDVTAIRAFRRPGSDAGHAPGGFAPLRSEAMPGAGSRHLPALGGQPGRLERSSSCCQIPGAMSSHTERGCCRFAGSPSVADGAPTDTQNARIVMA